MMLMVPWFLRAFPRPSSPFPSPPINVRAGGDSHLLRTGAMPALDENGKERRRRSPVFSSSGSESEIASSSGTTPARSRTSSRSSTRTTPARSRANSRGSLGIVTPGRSRAARNSARGLPPQRGTARNRGGSGGGGSVPRDHRRSPPSENSSGDSKTHRRTSSGSSGGGKKRSSGSRRDPEKSGKGGRTEHARRVSAPQASSSSKGAANGGGEGSGVSAAVGERDKAQGEGDTSKHKEGLYKQKATTAKSMPNMAAMLVAPLSRPIPTDSVGYWYNNGQDAEQSSRSRSRSQSATDCETSPAQLTGGGQPSRGRRQNGSRPISYVGKAAGARSNTHSHSFQLEEHAEEGNHDDARQARSPSPPPTTALVRGSSAPGKEPEVGTKVGRHHRRKSSGQQSEEDLLALSRSHRAAARDRLNGASSALPSTSKRYQSPPCEIDKVKVSAKQTKSGGRDRKSKHGRYSVAKGKEKDSRTSGDDGWKWSASDNPEPTDISGQPEDSASAGRVREDAGTTAPHSERNRTKLRAGVGAEGSNGAGPRQTSEKTRAASREGLEDEITVNVSRAAAKWQRVTSIGEAGAAADASAAVTNAAVIRTRRTAEAKAAEAAAALKAREEAEAKAAEAAEKLAAAKAAALAMSRASQMTATAATPAAAPVTTTPKRNEAKEEVGARPGGVVLDDKSVPVVRAQLPLLKAALSKGTAQSEPAQPLPVTAAAAATVATTAVDSVVVEDDKKSDESAAVSVPSDVPHVPPSSPPRRRSGEREMGWSEMAALATAQAKAAKEARQADDDGGSDSAEMLSESGGEQEEDAAEGQYVGNGREVGHGSDGAFHEREAREASEEMYLVRHSQHGPHERTRAFVMHEVILFMYRGTSLFGGECTVYFFPFGCTTCPRKGYRISASKL